MTRRRLPGEMPAPQAPLTTDPSDRFSGADHFLIEQMRLTVMSWQRKVTPGERDQGHVWCLPRDLIGDDRTLIVWREADETDAFDGWQPQAGPHVPGPRFARMRDALAWLRRARDATAGREKTSPGATISLDISTA